MKKDIHPTYYDTANIICSCGNSIITGSTLQQVHVEICSSCHSFYTGKKKIIDTAGKVEKFKERQKKARLLQEARGVSKSTARAKKLADTTAQKKTMPKSKKSPYIS